MENSVILDARKAVGFRSDYVVKILKNLKNNEQPLWDNAASLFENAYRNSINTTALILQGDPIRTYAGTGGWGCFGAPCEPVPLDPKLYPQDWSAEFKGNLLNAMWIRDACAQYYSYIGIFNAKEGKPSQDQLDALGTVIEGIVRLSADFLTYNYGEPGKEGPLGIRAHAFNCIKQDGSYTYYIYNEKEGKPNPHYEPDTLAYLAFLALDYTKASGSTKHLDDKFWNAMDAAINILEDKLHYFESDGTPTSTPTNYALTATPYRPSDDPVDPIWKGDEFVCGNPDYITIPTNAFLSVAMEKLYQYTNEHGLLYISKRAKILSQKLRNGVTTPGIGVVTDPHLKNGQKIDGPIFAYEINHTSPGDEPNLYDDAAIPSLLSFPYLGFCDANDTIYQNTRAFILSTANRYYHIGKDAKGNQYDGIGGEHTCHYGNYGQTDKVIWPMAIIMRAMTAEAAEDPVKERINALRMLVNSSRVEFDGDFSYFGGCFAKLESCREGGG